MQIVSRTPNDLYSNTDVWHVRAAHIDQVFRVCVTGPEFQSQNPAPAIAATDADLAAGAFISTTRLLAIGGEIPPSFSINIGYPIGHLPWHVIQRTRDLSPSARPNWDKLLPAIYGSDIIPRSGGGEAFLSFIVSELLPALAQAYPIDVDDVTLCGGSLGGLFTAFARVPAGGAVAICVGERERDHAEAVDSLLQAPPSVRQTLRDELAAIDMEAHMAELEAALAPWARDGFRVATRVLLDESHHSEIGAAASWGLRTLFAAD